MKNKRGGLMLFTAFLFIVLMSYISVAFLFDAPDNEGETLTLGKMVQDVYFPTYRFNREEASAIVINAARELNLDTKDLHFGLK